MRGGEDYGTDHDPGDPTVSLAKALKEKASEKYLLHDWGEDPTDEDKPCRRIEFGEDLQDLFPLCIHPKRREDQIMQNDEHIGRDHEAAPHAYDAGLEFSK